MDSPYLNARREWNERYGSYLAQARQWRLVALLCGVAVMVAVGGAFYFAQRSILIPYVVEIGPDSRVKAVSMLAAERAVDDRIVRATLARFIRDLRSVSADVAAQRRWVEAVYAHLTPQSPAYTAISEWLSEHTPMARAEEETVSVEVRQILALSENTYRVEWVEHHRARNGAEQSPMHWSGTMTAGLGAVDAKNILINPLGIFVRDFDWARDFGA